MDYTTMFSDLLSTPYGALFLGVSLTLGALTSALAIGYYSIFRYPSLMYFSISVVVSYLAFGMASPNPLQVFSSAANPYYEIQQILNLGSIFFFYKVVKASFIPAPTLPLPDYTYDVLAAALLLVRFYGIFDHDPLSFKIASLLTVLFLGYSAVIAMSFPAATSTMRLIKIGCAVPSGVIIAYPLVRAGVIMPNFLEGKMSLILMAALSLQSVFWFVGLVELAREAREKAQANMARTLVHLRDFMEAPLENIQTSVATLHRGDENISPILNNIDKSVSSLRLVKALLSRFEKNVPSSNRSRTKDGA